jgi:small subunit ribosomal protein S7
MSRRARKIGKRVSLDPKFNSELVARMIRVIMKDGKKTAAENIVSGAIEKIKEAVEKDAAKFTKDDKAFTEPLEILSAAIDNMKPQVEVKTRRVGGTTYPVPVPIAPNRQLSLALRWTTQYASARHGMGMPAAVAAEVIDAFLGQGSVIKKRDDVHKMAQANKAFAHYAWGNNAG